MLVGVGSDVGSGVGSTVGSGVGSGVGSATLAASTAAGSGVGSTVGSGVGSTVCSGVGGGSGRVGHCPFPSLGLARQHCNPALPEHVLPPSPRAFRAGGDGQCVRGGRWQGPGECPEPMRSLVELAPVPVPVSACGLWRRWGHPCRPAPLRRTARRLLSKVRRRPRRAPPASVEAKALPPICAL